VLVFLVRLSESEMTFFLKKKKKKKKRTEHTIYFPLEYFFYSALSLRPPPFSVLSPFHIITIIIIRLEKKKEKIEKKRKKREGNLHKEKQDEGKGSDITWGKRYSPEGNKRGTKDGWKGAI